MKSKINIVLAALLILLTGITYPEKDKKESDSDKKTFAYFNIRYRQVYLPDYGSREYRFFFEPPWLSNEKAAGKKAGNISQKSVESFHLITDKLDIRECLPNKKEIDLTFLYEIKDNFEKLPSIFKIGFDIYFLLEGSVERESKEFDGIYRLNEDLWYELITGTKFNFAADLGKNRVLGYYIVKPLRLYGFRQNFRDEFYIELPDFRYRLALHKLTDKKFLFHNYRAEPSDYSIEIYGIDGKRIKEFFNFLPFEQKPDYRVSLASQTVVTTDKQGHLFIAFQYPLNPYRVWKFDENGTKLKVFGNCFTEPEEYDFPGEWLRLSSKDIQYYGLPQVYAVNKILTDSNGRVFVFFSRNRIERKSRGEDTQKYFLDVYSKEGDFIGRTEFKYGFPELIDKDIIYSRMRDSSGRSMWKITAVRFTLK